MPPVDTTLNAHRDVPTLPPKGPTLVLIARVSLLLVYFDVLSLFGFSRAHRWIRRTPIADHQPGRISPSHVQLCRTVDVACALYPKRVFCLQRAAVTTHLLRTHGIAAVLVIGSRTMPLDSHAWVEVDGEVVNDRPQYKKFFTVLDGDVPLTVEI